MKVLVVGGTGPSGPHVVQGLLERGHDVTILHRGVHEPAGLPDVPLPTPAPRRVEVKTQWK